MASVRLSTGNERNIKEIMLMTLRGNATEHFYEKNGFETEKDLIFMKKQL